MATKRLDDLDWDMSLDYEFDDPFAPISEQKKRGVVTRMATNFSQGVADAFKTPSTLKSVAANMLPKGYGTAINFGEELYRQGEELHNIAMKELEPSLPAMRRITQRNLPKVKRFLPRGAAEKLEEFSKPQQGYRAPSDAQLQEQAVKSAMAEVFDVQMEAQARQNTEDRTERALQHAQLTATGRSQLRALELTQQGILRLVDYQDTITNRYQRKSLELQTRHYLLARDQARVQFESTRRMHAQLEMIAKNSAMPDIAKQDMRHTASQTFRNRLLGSMQDSAGRFAQDYMGKLFKRMQGSVRDMTGGMQDMIDMADSGGEGMPLMDMIMQTMGHGAVNLGSRFAGQFSRRAIGKFAPGSEQTASQLHRWLTSAPQYLNRYARSPTKREGWKGLAEEMFKDLLPTHTMDPQIGYSGLADMDKPATFDKLARLSLVEVIPGFLSRIEHNTARALDPNAERQIFNMDRRTFTNLRSAADDMSNRLMTRETRASVKQQANSFVDELIGDQQLSDGARKALVRQLLIDSGNGQPFDPDRYASSTENLPELNGAVREEINKIFKSAGRRQDGKRDQKWWADRSETFNQLNFGAVAPIHAAGVYRSAGYRDLLDEAGLIERDGFKDNLNLGKILQMVEEADYGDIKIKEKTAAERAKDMFRQKAADWTDGLVKKHGGSLGGAAKEARDVLGAKGEVLLSALKLKTGKYRDKLTGAPIFGLADIAGPVVDENGVTVLTPQQVAGGLTTDDGQPLPGPTQRMQQRAASVQPAEPMAPTTGVFGLPTPADQVQSAGPLVTFDGDELIRLNGQQVELLKVIADAIMAQGAGGGGDPGETRRRRGFLDSIALGGIKGAWRGAKGVAQGTWWWTKKVATGGFGALGFGARSVGAVVQGGAHRIGNMVRGIKDIYVQGKRKPVMIAQKIKLGHYQDLNTGKKVVRWSDITGPVQDLSTGETVLDQEDYDKGIFTKGPAGLVRLATKSLMNFGSAVVSFYGNVAMLPLKLGAAAIKGVGSTLKWLTNKQVDVYVKGESTPRLHATKMKLGRYYNVHPKKMGVKVKTYSDIFGEIKELQPGAHEASRDDKTVLHEEEITDPGLVNRWGMSLRTPLGRLIGAIGGAAVSVVKGAGALFGGAMRGYGKLFGGMMGLGGGILGAPFKFLGSLLNPFEKHGAKQVELLEAIHRLLDARLPGAKARKGSWQEQFEKKEAAEKEQEAEKEKEERDRKWGVGGLLSFFKDKAKGLFGFGGDDEEDDEGGDDGDTTIIAGGGGGDGDGKKKRKSKGPAKTGGRLNRWRRDRAAKKARRERAKSRRGPGRLARMGRMASLGGLAGMVAADPIMDAVGMDEDGWARGAVDTGMNALGLYSLFAAGKGLLGWGAGTAATSAGLGAAGTAAATTAAAGTAAAGTATAGAGLAAAGTAAGMGGAGAAASGAAAVGGTAAAVLGAPVWVPLAIGAAVAAGVGAAAYYGYRQVKYGKLTPTRRFRYLQYGIKPGDAGHNRKIFLLEELLQNHVGEQNGAIDIVSKPTSGTGKPIAMKDIYDIFGLNEGWFFSRDTERRAFNGWFTNRFKPVFLLWHAAVRAEDPQMSVLEADEKLPGEKMLRVLNKAWGVTQSIYAVSVGPFDGEPVITDAGQIEEAYLLARKEAGKSEAEKASDKKWSTFKTAATLAGGPASWLAGSFINNQLDERKAKAEANQLFDKELSANTGDNLLKTAGAVAFTKGADEALPSTLVRTGRVTSLMSLRFKAYGLNDLELDRVRALSVVESVTAQHMSYSSDGRVQVNATPDQVYVKVCGLFGLLPRSMEDLNRWTYWYGNRFLPVFVEYYRKVKELNPNADIQSPERVLKADQQLEVGQAIMSAKNVDGRAVWSFTASPWSSQERLLSDPGAISGTLIALKQSAEKKLAIEPRVAGQEAEVERNKGFLQRAWNGVKGATGSAVDWLLGDKDNRNWFGKAVDGVVNVGRDIGNSFSNATTHFQAGEYGAAAGATLHGITAPGRAITGAMGFGPGLQHPGKGTGGDINALPDVPRNEEIASMRPAQRFAVLKPLFDAVARMTGVDPNMLYAICSIESTFNPNAKAPTSSASGLFQFIKGTWAESLRKHGQKFGISPSASPFDPKANALLGAMFLKDNFNHLKSRLNRGINETDIYMAHFMGAGGASDFLKRDPNAIGAQVFPKQAAANKWIFYDTVRQGNRRVPDMSKPLTLGQIYQLMQGKVSKAQEVYGGRQAVANATPDFSNVNTADTKPDFSNVASSASSTGDVPQYSNAIPTDIAPSDTASQTPVNPPVTTTTTAAGPQGGIGAVSVAAGSAGVNMSTTGHGYAEMAATGALPGSEATVTPAPRLDSVASLEAAAQSRAREETARYDAERRAAAEEERRRREVEAQNTRASQADDRRFDHTAELMKKQLETQVEIRNNTASTVTLLRQLLHSKGTNDQNKVAATAEATQSERPRARPYDGRQDPLPVSVRHPHPN